MPQHHRRLCPFQRPERGYRGQPTELLCRRTRLQCQPQGRTFRTFLRRVQHTFGHVGRRAGLLAGYRTRVQRRHPARCQAAVCLRRSHRTQSDGNLAQELRRFAHRHELQTVARRLKLRLAVGRDCRDGSRRCRGRALCQRREGSRGPESFPGRKEAEYNKLFTNRTRLPNTVISTT